MIQYAPRSVMYVKNKFLRVFHCCLFVIFLLAGNTYAEVYDNLTCANCVSLEMSDPNYWVNNLDTNPDRLLLNSREILKVNKEISDEEGTCVLDLTKMEENCKQSDRKKELLKSVDDVFEYMVRRYPNKDRKLYVDGYLIDNFSYFQKLKDAISNTGFVDDDKIVQIYSVAVERADIKNLPTSKVWGYDEPNDPDDESLNSVLEVNEPFVIRAKCEIDGEIFYYGLSNSCDGWVNAKSLALFKTKSDWLDAWKVDINKKGFLVVLQDKIVLEQSLLKPKTSGVTLYQGTVLKLVPYNKLPVNVGERSTWHNYVVYLPTRDEEGNYAKEYALIPMHSDVSVGYLPLTQKNILHVAFNCLGNRYGWGGMLGATDCSSYCKAIYKCFGLDLPRNTDWQEKVPNRCVDLKNMTNQEKNDFIKKLPIGSLLYMDGHVVMFIGSNGDDNFVIHNSGSMLMSDGSVRSISIVVSPLSVKRRSGKTYLESLNCAVLYDNECFVKN